MDWSYPPKSDETKSYPTKVVSSPN